MEATLRTVYSSFHLSKRALALAHLGVLGRVLAQPPVGLPEVVKDDPAAVMAPGQGSTNGRWSEEGSQGSQGTDLAESTMLGEL